MHHDPMREIDLLLLDDILNAAGASSHHCSQHLRGEPTMQRRNFYVSRSVRLLQVSVLLAMAAGVAALAVRGPEVTRAPATLVVVAAP
jgi:hypothetical protein